MSLKNLDWESLLEQTRSFATCDLTREKILQMRAFEHQEQALEQIENVFQAQQIVLSGVRPFFESLDLCEVWIHRLKKQAVLQPLELKDVRHFCFEALALRDCLQNLPTDWSKEQLQLFMNTEEALSAIDQILTPGGEIRIDASQRLYQLHKEKENLARQVQNQLDRLVSAHSMANILQDKFVTTREGRWVLPIKSGMQHSLQGVIHGSSQTKQTVYMEPEAVIPMNNRLREIEVEIEEEIERLLTELSIYLSRHASEFSETKTYLLSMDYLLSLSQLSLRLDAKRFQFSLDRIRLQDIKHPLMVMAGKDVVANTGELNHEKSVLLLSGPNAGGKTVLLKSVGLAAQMARCGLPLCADESSEIPFFRHIHLGIGDSQSVGEELSTFAAHVKMLQQGLNLKGPQELILVDEICGSTDPEEGSALARSFIESYASNGVFCVITSHLGPLKTGWKNEDPVLNGSLEYDMQSGRPTYIFLPGMPGDSLALQTARRVGVASSILDRATELLTPASRQRMAAMQDLEGLKKDLQMTKEHMQSELRKAQEQKKKYQALYQQLEQEKEKILSKTMREAQKKVDEAITHAKVDQSFKRFSALQEIKYNLPEIVKAKAAAQDAASGAGGSSAGPRNAEEFGRMYPAGTKVFVPSLQQDGLIQSTPNNKGLVTVLANSIRLTLSWQELRPAEKPTNPTKDFARRQNQVNVAILDADRVVDLRGKTVEDSLSILEMELDRAAANKEDRLKIIHGHGTEVLKKSVRTYLSRSVYVKKWKAGAPEQGGDGMTWVELMET